jgi:hypothetical protein
MEGLPGRFFHYIKQHPEVLNQIRDWQETNRHLFMGPTEELPLESTVSYNSFIQLVDEHLGNFLTESGADSDDFAAALLEMKASEDPHWKSFDLLLQKVDFDGFRDLLRRNVCLCCGGTFNPRVEPGSLALGEQEGAEGAVVPEGWTVYTDEASGRPFYYNTVDGSTSWELPSRTASGTALRPVGPTCTPPQPAGVPAALPPGWTSHQDPSTGQVYYVNDTDGTSTWAFPTAVGMPPVPSGGYAAGPPPGG